MVEIKQIYIAGVLPLLEPVPIFHREEVRWGGNGKTIKSCKFVIE